jgi:hypothetical protein
MSFDYEFSTGGLNRFVGLDNTKFSTYFPFVLHKNPIQIVQHEVKKNRFVNPFRRNQENKPFANFEKIVNHSFHILQQKFEQAFQPNEYVHLRDTFANKIFHC